VQIHEALLIEGKSKFGILCYGVFARGELESAYKKLSLKAESMDSRVHRFLSEDWPNGVLLNEVLVPQAEDIPRIAAEALTQMFKVGTCLAAVCMYDGAFGSYDDIFAPGIASQTYAFCLSHGEPVIVLDSGVIASTEWTAIIAGARERLG